MYSTSTEKQQSMKARLITLAVLTTVALTIACVLAAAARSTTYDDIAVDANGNILAMAPEHPWLGRSWDVGAKCAVGSAQKRITVRPPTVKPLRGYSSQYVYWQPFWVDIYTRTTYWGNWTRDIAYNTQPAVFGRHDPSLLTLDDYWTAGQTLTLYPSDGASYLDPVAAHIKVAWYTSSGTFGYANFKVDWMSSTSNQYAADRAC